MFVSVNLAKLTDEGRNHGFCVDKYQVTSPELCIFAIKSQLRAAQSVWPELGEYMLVNKFTRVEPGEPK